MTPVERLQAAIDLLEAIQLDLGTVEMSADGQLLANADHDFDDDGEPYVFGQRIEMPDYKPNEPEVLRAIHALTRPEMIDAQLAILRMELATAEKYGWPPHAFEERVRVLDLADAILGGAE